jgi:hypothetical protein
VKPGSDGSGSAPASARPIATTTMPEPWATVSRQSSSAEPAAPTSAPKTTKTTPNPSTKGATPRSVFPTPRRARRSSTDAPPTAAR